MYRYVRVGEGMCNSAALPWKTLPIQQMRYTMKKVHYNRAFYLSDCRIARRAKSSTRLDITFKTGKKKNIFQRESMFLLLLKIVSLNRGIFTLH